MNKLLLGLLAGVAVGMLLAPDKGSETVRRLRDRLSEYKDQVDDLTSKAGSLFDKGKSKMKESFD